MKKMILISLLWMFFPWLCFGQAEQSYDNSIDFSSKTQRLWGISEVRVNGDGTVTLVDAVTGYGYGLFVFDGPSGFLEKITLSPGQSFVLTDGDHAFLTYKLVRIEKDQIIFEVTDKFDARAFGDGVKIETKEVSIAPYAAEK